MKEVARTLLEARERVMIFIDGSNLFHACNQIKFKIDLVKLVNVLVGDRYLVRPYYYTAFNPQKQEQIKFFTRFRVRASVLKRYL